MSLTFDCFHCNSIIKTHFIKVGEEALCTKCKKKTVVPSSAEESKNDKPPKISEDIKSNITEQEKESNYQKNLNAKHSEPVTEHSKIQRSPKSNLDKENIKDYPALKFLSGVANFIAWLGVITSIIGGLIYLGNLTKYSSIEMTIIVLVGLALFTFIVFVFWRAISEILILFVDMAQDIRRTRLKD